MNGFEVEPDDATPLSPEEREGLRLSHLTLRSELNEQEQSNIIEAVLWADERKRRPVSEAFGRSLHKRMFGKVWRWAGTYRTTNKNIGVDAYQIAMKLAETYEQVGYWAKHQTFSADEVAVRFHHMLVAVHPFPNGNGRWSRLMADLLVVSLGGNKFSWGSTTLHDIGETRRAYIDALRQADQHDLAPLIRFARS